MTQILGSEGHFMERGVGRSLSFFKLHLSSFYTRFDYHFFPLTFYLGVIPNE
jgi:hypothetical protein